MRPRPAYISPAMAGPVRTIHSRPFSTRPAHHAKIIDRHVFRDVTPPVGHPLCGGWIEPVRGVDDPLKALGVVLLGVGQAGRAVRRGLVRHPQRGLPSGGRRSPRPPTRRPNTCRVHCVHPHNAPFADVEAAEAASRRPKGPPSLDLKFFDDCVKTVRGRLQGVARRSGASSRTSASGSAKVEQVASNRRVARPGRQGEVHPHSATKTRSPRRPRKA